MAFGHRATRKWSREGVSILRTSVAIASKQDRALSFEAPDEMRYVDHADASFGSSEKSGTAPCFAK